MPVVSRRYTRTARGVRVQYQRRNVRKVQHVKLATAAPGYLQARVTRAPSFKATKFWQSTTHLVANKDAITSGGTRNVKTLNLIQLGPDIYQRIGNRVFLQSMMINFTVNAPLPRGSGGAAFMGNHPSTDVYRVPTASPEALVRHAGPYPSWTVSLVLVWVPRPREEVPSIEYFFDNDIGSADYISAGGMGMTPIDDMFGARVLVNKTVKVSLQQHVVWDPVGVGPGEGSAKMVWSVGPSTVVQEKLFIPLNRSMSFTSATANPGYINVEYGALILYAFCNTPSSSSSNTMPKVDIFTRTAFNDFS